MERQNQRKKNCKKNLKKLVSKLDERRFYNNWTLYGYSFSVTTQKLKNCLICLEFILPFTFYLLSSIGILIVKKFGNRELLRININSHLRKF